jgi:deoxyribodipyrimidine photo-lyase
MDKTTKPDQIKNSIFLFHRDLRLTDNIGFLETCDLTKQNIYPVFIFTPEQVTNKNKYKSDNAIEFMLDSLDELSGEISRMGGKLHIFYGNTVSILEQLIKEWHIDLVAFNRDYTPYATQRDQDISQMCVRRNMLCKTFVDYYLFEPGEIVNSQGRPFRIFTPFYDAEIHRAKEIKHPKSTRKYNGLTNGSSSSLLSLKTIREKILPNENPNILVHGGRVAGIKCLKRALSNLGKYGKTRDYMILETSRLSAYLKFGCLSIREVFHAFVNKYGLKSEIIRELIWRDFFAHLLFFYPKESIGHSYDPKYRKIPWKHNVGAFQKWCKGLTGVPIVDAGMRELNATGYMHNRARMIVANFLTKTLLIDWRWGEQYFAQHLTDYDIASNTGNWQAIAGGGAYQTAYFRIMNPWIQSAKFDPDAEYIKKWIPELREVPTKDIHKWYTACENYKKIYPKPIADYDIQKKIVLDMYHKYI